MKYDDCKLQYLYEQTRQSAFPQIMFKMKPISMRQNYFCVSLLHMSSYEYN